MSLSSTPGKEVASAFTRSPTLTSQPRVECAAFSCFTELTHRLRYLAQKSQLGDAIAPQKILAFLLGTSIFYPYKFSGTEPSNFSVMGVQLLICLLLSLWSSDITVARQIFATLDAGLLPQM